MRWKKTTPSRQTKIRVSFVDSNQRPHQSYHHSLHHRHHLEHKGVRTAGAVRVTNNPSPGHQQVNIESPFPISSFNAWKQGFYSNQMSTTILIVGTVRTQIFLCLNQLLESEQVASKILIGFLQLIWNPKIGRLEVLIVIAC